MASTFPMASSPVSQLLDPVRTASSPVYKPLDPTRKEIRLLRLAPHHGSEEETITCGLLCMSLALPDADTVLEDSLLLRPGVSGLVVVFWSAIVSFRVGMESILDT